MNNPDDLDTWFRWAVGIFAALLSMMIGDGAKIVYPDAAPAPGSSQGPTLVLPGQADGKPN